MIVKHKEFSFKVLAPDNFAKCQYVFCKEQGDFAVVAKNDRDEFICEFRNICDRHIIMAFIDALGED